MKLLHRNWATNPSALWLRALLGAWLFVVNGTLVQAADYGDISIRLDNLSPNSEGGYQEWRATIINHSPVRAHRVTLILPDQLYGARGECLREIRRSVEVAPNATARISLFQPPLPLSGTGARVLVDEQTQEALIPLNFSDRALPLPFMAPSIQPTILLSPETGKSKALYYAASVLPDSDGKPAFATTMNELPLSEWSSTWLGYNGYGGVVLTANEWRTAPDGVRQALWRYLEVGGCLLIFGDIDVPAPWQASRSLTSHQVEATVVSEPAAAATPPAPATGAAVAAAPEATPSPTPTPVPAPAVKEALQSYDVGFGVLFVMPAQAQPALTAAQWQAVKTGWTASQIPHVAVQFGINQLSFEVLNNQLPIIEKLTVPVRGLFILMLLFVIVIGPVNLLVLARRQKKIWLLWTVPALSLATCLAIAVYAIGSEGVRGHARFHSLTLLDETAHRATTFGVTGLYSPLTPSDGLHFDYETEVMPVLPYVTAFNNRGGTPRSVDWTNEQHLTSGWVGARVPTWLQTRRSETRRERLTVSFNSTGQPSVTNGLGVAIRHLWLPNDKRTLYEASDIAPGAQVELKASPRPGALETPPKLGQLLVNNWLESMNKLAETPEEFLAPGTYLAVLEAAPFNEPALRNVRQTTAKTLVYGLRGK